jgi:hypothetical protein
MKWHKWRYTWIIPIGKKVSNLTEYGILLSDFYSYLIEGGTNPRKRLLNNNRQKLINRWKIILEVNQQGFWYKVGWVTTEIEQADWLAYQKRSIILTDWYISVCVCVYVCVYVCIYIYIVTPHIDLDDGGSSSVFVCLFCHVFNLNLMQMRVF